MNCAQFKGAYLHVINTKLDELNCSVNKFSTIVAGIIGRTKLIFGLRDNNLDRNIEETLLRILDEMAELKSVSLVAPDWTDTERIRERLAKRRALKLCVKYDSDSMREFLGVA